MALFVETLREISTSFPESKIGVFARDIQDNRTVEVNSEEVFGTASIIKIPIAIAFFKAHESGKLDIDKQFSLESFSILDKGNRDSGMLKNLPHDSPVSLRFLCSLMLSVSDNAATNVLLQFVKRDQINDLMSELGFPNTKILIDTLDPKKLLEEKNPLGETTAKEMTSLLMLLAQGKLLTEEDTDFCIKLLSTNQTNVAILRNLPLAKNVKDGHVKIEKTFVKGGIFPELLLNVETAGFIVDSKPRIFMSIFTQGIDHPVLRSVATDHPSNKYIGEISSEIINTFLL